jgi:hypothetical protein
VSKNEGEQRAHLRASVQDGSGFSLTHSHTHTHTHTHIHTHIHTHTYTRTHTPRSFTHSFTCTPHAPAAFAARSFSGLPQPPASLRFPAPSARQPVSPSLSPSAPQLLSELVRLGPLLPRQAPVRSPLMRCEAGLGAPEGLAQLRELLQVHLVLGPVHRLPCLVQLHHTAGGCVVAACHTHALRCQPHSPQNRVGCTSTILSERSAPEFRHFLDGGALQPGAPQRSFPSTHHPRTHAPRTCGRHLHHEAVHALGRCAEERLGEQVGCHHRQEAGAWQRRAEERCALEELPPPHARGGGRGSVSTGRWQAHEWGTRLGAWTRHVTPS